MTSRAQGGLGLLLAVMVSACCGSGRDRTQPRADDDDPPPAPGETTTDRKLTVDTLSPIRCHHARALLAAGTYHGDLVVSGNHCTVEGAGPDQTIIDGALLFSGNHNLVSGLTVLKPSKVTGNHNDATGVTFRAAVTTGGNHSTP